MQNIIKMIFHCWVVELGLQLNLPPGHPGGLTHYTENGHFLLLPRLPDTDGLQQLLALWVEHVSFQGAPERGHGGARGQQGGAAAFHCCCPQWQLLGNKTRLQI